MIKFVSAENVNDKMTDSLENLNAAQLEAVHHKDGPCLVLAGPGSGKTRVVTHRIAWLIEQGVPPWQIAALTFTNKAAEEMKNRVAQLVPGRRIWIGTFHRFCAQLMRTYAPLLGYNSNFTIYDADESKQILLSLIDKKDLPNGVDAPKIASAISWAKNALILPENYTAREGHLLGKVVEQIYPEYQDALKKANAVDFDDLLVQIAVLLHNNQEVRKDLDARYRYVLVDEYQDTNLAQYAIARALSIDYPNLSVTGDPDQSIYGWRGANIKNILDFEKDFKEVKVIRLEENYRSTPEILRAASELIRHNVFRKEKELFTEKSSGPRPRVVVCLNHLEESNFIAAEIAAEIAAGKRRPHDYALFYRMNALSRNLEHSLHKYGVPFQLVRGLEFFNRKEIKDIIAYLQLLYNLNDTVSFRRVINTPSRGIGKTSIAKIEDFAARAGISLWEATQKTAAFVPERRSKKRAGDQAEINNDHDRFFQIEKAPKLPDRSRKALEKFVNLINSLRQTAVDSDLEVLLSLLLKETGYISALKLENTEEDQQRLANVQELLSEAREFDLMFNETDEDEPETSPLDSGRNFGEFERLGRFLERAALVSDVDALDSDSDRVSLMTFHAAKGLEFPVVYIIALEENILPHERSTSDKNQLEEERRLLFVGITRAREELRITRTRFREFRGTLNSSILSRFLFEIPKDCLQSYGSPDEALGKDFAQEEAPFTPDAPSNSDPTQMDALPRGGRSSFCGTAKRDPLADYYQSKNRGGSSKSKNDKSSDLTENSDNPIYFIDPPQPSEPVRVYIPEPEMEASSKKNGALPPEDNEYIDGEVFYEEEAELEYDENGKAHPKKPEKKKTPKRPKTPPRHDLSAAITIGADLLDDHSEQNKPHKKQDKESLMSVGTLVRHANYGVGVIKEIFGPKGDRIVSIEFLTGIGQIDIELNDSHLTILPNRNRKR